MTPQSEAIVRRMAAAGYLPSEAVLSGLGVKEREFVALWVNAHADHRPERDVVADALLELATEVTGEPQRRSSSALFAMTMAAFDKGDVALPKSYVDRTLALFRDVQRLDLTEDERSASVLESAIRRLERRQIAGS